MGWSYGAIAFAFSLQWLLTGLTGPVMGWLGDRNGVRKTMVVGAFFFIAGMLLTGTMSQLWQFYLFFGILLGAAISVFQVPLVSGVTVWFRTNLGPAMGGLQALQSLGTVGLIPLIAYLFDQFGLKWTFWFPGIIGGVLLLLLIRPFHNEPADIGLRPVGAPEDEPIRRLQGDDTAKIRTSVFLRQAQRTGAFWNLIGIHFWGCMGHNIFIVFLIAMAVCFSLQVLPPIVLLLSQEAWAFYLFAGLFGIGLGGEVPAFPIINRQYFGHAPIGTVYGWQMLGNGLGMALGPLAGGFLWDITGDFASVVVLSSALSLVGLVSVLLLPTTSRLLTPNWETFLPPAVRSQL